MDVYEVDERQRPGIVRFLVKVTPENSNVASHPRTSCISYAWTKIPWTASTNDSRPLAYCPCSARKLNHRIDAETALNKSGVRYYQRLKIAM